MSIEIKRSDKYVDYNISATNNRGYITIDTSDWINKPWMFYELPALKFEIYTETGGELVKYQNFTREIRTYNPVYSPLGVLNVTIDIRNVPEEFILRITPIFDNDAIAARNMLIENGIENGDIWGSDQDVPTQLFNLDLEFIECEGEYVPPTPPVPPIHEETITGVPPITFDGSTGEPLVSWTILGNGQQTVTPSTNNPVDFVRCGTKEMHEVSVTYQSPAYTYEVKKGGLVDAIKQLGAGRYTFSWDFQSNATGTFKDRLRLYANGVNKMEIANGNTIDFTETLVQEIQNAQNFSIQLYYGQGNTDGYFKDFVFDAGYKIPITCAEQTVHVYLGQVHTLRRIGKIDLASLTWTVISGGLWICKNVPNIKYTSSNEELGNGVAEKYVIHTGKGMTTATNCIAIDISHISVNTGSNSVSPTGMFWYVLAEPTTGIVNEPLAKIGDYADELSSAYAGVTIPTIEGQNTLTVDTDLQPSEMTITYMKKEE